MRGWRAPKFVIAVFLALAISNGLVFLFGVSLGDSQDEISQTRRVQARILVLVRQAQQTHLALCTFQGQLSDNVAAQTEDVARNQAFLRSHPDGLPALGISRAQLAQSVAGKVAQLARTKAARRSLAGLDDCPSASR